MDNTYTANYNVAIQN